MESQDIEQKFEKIQKEINELKKYKEENEEYKKKSKMEINSLKQKISHNKIEINSLNQKNSDNKIEILRLKSDLQLINIRSCLKVFVNYMYIGLK